MPAPLREAFGQERQLTTAPHGHILTNIGVWSPDSQWLAYDVRSDPAGAVFDGQTIELVHARTGEVRELYRSHHGACCGVVTFHPHQKQVLFILGPEHPTADWQYGPFHRQGVIVHLAEPGRALNLEARDLVSPYTPGALRGGTHVHVWEPAGQWVAFTYEDHVLAGFTQETADQEINLRNIGVSVPHPPVQPHHSHPRNHNGTHFSVLVTRTVAQPKPGSDEIQRACEEGWVGTNGYLRPDRSRQPRALAFQGQVVTETGEAITEVFIVDLPEDVTVPGDGPLAGTPTRRPAPPRATSQRRLTRTADRRFPGLQGPRHWLRSSPDGTRIAFLMKGDDGIVQLWTVSPNGGPPVQVTHHPFPIASAFSWSPDGERLAFVLDNSVCLCRVNTGETVRLTPRTDDASAPRPEACVFSPDGQQIAYVRRQPAGGKWFNQLFTVRP